MWEYLIDTSTRYELPRGDRSVVAKDSLRTILERSLLDRAPDTSRGLGNRVEVVAAVHVRGNSTRLNKKDGNTLWLERVGPLTSQLVEARPAQRCV